MFWELLCISVFEDKTVHKSMSIAPLKDIILKLIAKIPSKCMTEAGIKRLLQAVNSQTLFQNEDIVQVILNHIIDAGRMTDDASPVSLYKNRSTLMLANSKISGRYLLKAVEQCSKTLVKLDVHGCFQVDDGKMADVLESCPNLISINIRNCRKITDKFLETLVKYPRLPLQELDIGGNFNITNGGVRSFLEKFSGISKLTSFSVSGLPILDDTVKIMIKKLKSINTIGLAYLDIPEETWERVLRELGPQIVKLDISWPSTTPLSHHQQPSAEKIINAIIDCPNLIDVDLTGNKMLSYSHIVNLVEGRFTHTQDNPTLFKQFQIVRVKFIASPKSTMENQVNAVYSNYIKFVL